MVRKKKSKVVKLKNKI